MEGQYGLLLNQKDILLQRKYFEEMCQLIGVKVIHRSPRQGKHIRNILYNKLYKHIARFRHVTS